MFGAILSQCNDTIEVLTVIDVNYPSLRKTGIARESTGIFTFKLSKATKELSAQRACSRPKIQVYISQALSNNKTVVELYCAASFL